MGGKYFFEKFLLNKKKSQRKNKQKKKQASLNHMSVENEETQKFSRMINSNYGEKQRLAAKQMRPNKSRRLCLYDIYSH